MPSKNKNIIRRRKTRKQQHRSRKHKRNNNNARNQTIRGGSQWMRWKKKNRVHPEPTDPIIPPSQPHLPTNVDSVTIAAREEVSRGHRVYINGLKKLIEPQTKKMKDLTDEYNMLGKRKDETEDQTERHQMFVRRHQIHEEIARIKREKIVGQSRVEDIEKEIRTKEMADASYRRIRKLPLLPTDGILDPVIEINRLTHDLDVAETSVNRKALNAEFELGVQSNEFDQFMSEMSDSPRGSTPSRDATHDDAAGVGRLPPGLPPGHRRAHLERGPPSDF